MPPSASSRDLSKPIERLEFLVDKKSAGSRLDRFLQEKLPWRSRTGIQKLIEEGRILRLQPGQTQEVPASRVAARLALGEKLALLVPEPRELGAIFEPPVPSDIPIVYEDAFMLAVDKPPFLPVHPSARYRTETLIGWLHKRYRRHEDPTRDIVPKLCHRIDRETSGLVLVAKDDRVRSDLGKIFEGRRVEKEYLAIVEGEVRDKRGKIDLPIAPMASSQVLVRVEAREGGKGLPSMTEYEVVSRHPGHTLVKAKPKTGRQHQIRVHFQAIGYPLVGDKIYGPDETIFLKSLESALSAEDLARLKMPRQALHAHKLRFEHPVSKKTLEIESPLPADMKEFLARLGDADGSRVGE